jgi:hypothetical protein
LHTLQNWQNQFASRADVRLVSDPRDIALMFDKPSCHRECQRAEVPVPEAVYPVKSFDDLVERMKERQWERVFVKMAHGSSACGVVAIYRRREYLEAITSAELASAEGETRLYNSLKIRRYTSLDDVRAIVDALVPHGVHVEKWLPKAACDRRVCDLRVLVISRRPQHVVVRTSRTPLTNLHLGNRRGNVERVFSRISATEHEALAATCQRTASLFAGSLQIGLDILFTPGFRRHFLLEVNAFGDLLPGVRYNGKDTYEAQVDAAIMEQEAPAA